MNKSLIPEKQNIFLFASQSEGYIVGHIQYVYKMIYGNAEMQNPIS